MSEETLSWILGQMFRQKVPGRHIMCLTQRRKSIIRFLIFYFYSENYTILFGAVNKYVFMEFLRILSLYNPYLATLPHQILSLSKFVYNIINLKLDNIYRIGNSQIETIVEKQVLDSDIKDFRNQK